MVNAFTRNILLLLLLVSSSVAIAAECVSTTHYYNGYCGGGELPADPGYYVKGDWLGVPTVPGRTSKAAALQSCRNRLEAWDPDYYTNTIYHGLATVTLNGYQSTSVGTVLGRYGFINGKLQHARIRFWFVSSGLQGTFPKENFRTGLRQCINSKCETRFYWENYNVIQGNVKEVTFDGCTSPFEEDKKYFINLTSNDAVSGLGSEYVAKIYPENYTLNVSDPEVHPMLALLTAQVVDNSGVIQNDIQLKIEIEPIEQTGGHLGITSHVTRPKLNRTYGSLRRIGDNLNLTGLEIEGSTATSGFQFYYASPELSGDYKLKITCVDIECFQQDPSIVYVGVDGLSSLGSSSLYGLTGVTEFHNDNHYVSAETRVKLFNLVQRYNRYRQNNKIESPNIPAIHFNDASLVQGGTFDIKGTWKNKHTFHRVGTDVDIRANGAS